MFLQMQISLCWGIYFEQVGVLFLGDQKLFKQIASKCFYFGKAIIEREKLVFVKFIDCGRFSSFYGRVGRNGGAQTFQICRKATFKSKIGVYIDAIFLNEGSQISFFNEYNRPAYLSVPKN